MVLSRSSMIARRTGPMLRSVPLGSQGELHRWMRQIGHDGRLHKSALRVYVGLRVAGTGWGHYVTRMPRASKLRGLVKPWALRLSTWSRLLMPSILPLEGWPVWCQLRISSDQAMMVSTVMLLCLSSRDLDEVLLVAFGEVAVVVEASFEC